MRRRRVFLALSGLVIALLAGVIACVACWNGQPVDPAPAEASPLDALNADERALFRLVERSVVLPVEWWLASPGRELPGEKVDQRKRLFGEFGIRASFARIPTDGLETRLASMGAKVRALPGIAEDEAAIATLAAGDFEALREPTEGAGAALRVWLTLAKARVAGWQLPEAVKAMERAMALWPAGANPKSKRYVVIIHARALGWLERFAEGEALLRTHGPQADGPKWPDADAAWWANELAMQLTAQGKLAEAETELRRSLDLGEKCLGVIHANIARGCANLASVLVRRGNLEEAARFIHRAEAVGEKTIVQFDTCFGAWAIMRGSILIKQEKLEEAMEYLNAALARAEKNYGAGHFITLQLQQGVAECTRRSGAHTAGTRLQNEALADMEDLVRESDPQRAGVLNAQARALVFRGDSAAAERIYRHALELLERVDLPLERSAAYTGLCGILIQARRHAEARPLLERAVAQTESARGDSAPELVQLIAMLASVRQWERKPAIARMLFERSLSLAEKGSGKESALKSYLLAQFALFEEAEGHFAEAEKLIRQAWDGYRKQSGPQSRDTISVNFLLVKFLQEQRRLPEALQAAQEGLKMADAVLAPNAPEYISFLGWTARIYQDLNRHADAKLVASRALAIAMAVRGEDHPETAGAAATLATSLFAHGEDEEAAKLLQFALGIVGRTPGRSHPDLSMCFNDLARICLTKGLYANVEALLRGSLAICEEQLGADNPALAASLSRLGDFLAKRGRLAEAEPLLRRALTILSRDLRPGSPVPDPVTQSRAMYRALLEAQRVAEKDIELRIRTTLPTAK
jgi:tetratricopeptide (TPR) repeat protein